MERFYSTNISSLRSEEHTSELQSPKDLVCRLLLEKKKDTAALRGDVRRRADRRATQRAVGAGPGRADGRQDHPPLGLSRVVARLHVPIPPPRRVRGTQRREDAEPDPRR